MISQKRLKSIKIFGFGELLAAELSNDVETTFSNCSILFAWEAFSQPDDPPIKLVDSLADCHRASSDPSLE